MNHSGKRKPRAFSCPALLALVVGLLAPPPGDAAQRALEDLAARLEGNDARMRRDAVEALREDGSDEAVLILNSAAADPDTRVRRDVLEALLSFRRPATSPGLITFLADEERDHRREAVRGLVAAHAIEPSPGRGTRAVNWLMRRDEDFVLDPLRPVGSATTEALAGRLQDEDDEVRELAASALGALEAAAEAPALARSAASDTDGGVQRAAIASLGEIGTDTAGDFLVGLLETSGREREIIEALGTMAYRPGGAAILAAYDEDPGSDRGRTALLALARMGHAGARGAFYHELRSRDGRRRAHAAEGLGRLDDRALVDGLIRDLLREDDDRVELAFCFALARLGQTPFVDKVVLSLADGRLRSFARSYALELGSSYLNEFIAYLDDPERDVRLELIGILERIGDSAAVPALTRLGTDADEALAVRARAAVRRLAPSDPGEGAGGR